MDRAGAFVLSLYQQLLAGKASQSRRDRGLDSGHGRFRFGNICSQVFRAGSNIHSFVWATGGFDRQAGVAWLSKRTGTILIFAGGNDTTGGNTSQTTVFSATTSGDFDANIPAAAERMCFHSLSTAEI